MKAARLGWTSAHFILWPPVECLGLQVPCASSCKHSTSWSLRCQGVLLSARISLVAIAPRNKPTLSPLGAAHRAPLVLWRPAKTAKTRPRPPEDLQTDPLRCLSEDPHRIRDEPCGHACGRGRGRHCA